MLALVSFDTSACDQADSSAAASSGKKPRTKGYSALSGMTAMSARRGRRGRESPFWPRHALCETPEVALAALILWPRLNVPACLSSHASVGFGLCKLIKATPAELTKPSREPWGRLFHSLGANVAGLVGKEAKRRASGPTRFHRGGKRLGVRRVRCRRCQEALEARGEALCPGPEARSGYRARIRQNALCKTQATVARSG